MRPVWDIPLMFIPILLLFCFTSIAFAQQKPTEVKDRQYVETVDLRELVQTVKELTRNVQTLSNNQKELTNDVKELTKSVKELTKSVNNINTRMAVIEERTTWITAILFIILAAIFGGVVTYFLSNRRKKKKSILEIIGNQDETPYDISTEDELQTERETP